MRTCFLAERSPPLFRLCPTGAVLNSTAFFFFCFALFQRSVFILFELFRRAIVTRRVKDRWGTLSLAECRDPVASSLRLDRAFFGLAWTLLASRDGFSSEMCRIISRIRPSSLFVEWVSRGAGPSVRRVVFREPPNGPDFRPGWLEMIAFFFTLGSPEAPPDDFTPFKQIRVSGLTGTVGFDNQ